MSYCKILRRVFAQEWEGRGYGLIDVTWLRRIIRNLRDCPVYSGCRGNNTQGRGVSNNKYWANILICAPSIIKDPGNKQYANKAYLMVELWSIPKPRYQFCSGRCLSQNQQLISVRISFTLSFFLLLSFRSSSVTTIRSPLHRLFSPFHKRHSFSFLSLHKKQEAREVKFLKA